jgi:hypothetical protein
MRDTGDMGDTGNRDDMTNQQGEESLRLDGNAAAGLLSEIFVWDMSDAQTTCGHCGSTGALGSLLLYGGQVGAVLRCPSCEQVQMRVVRVPERGGQRYWLDMQGIAVLRITPQMSQ